MKLKLLFILVCILVVCQKPWAQCTTLGQTPQTAFPVCGTNAFVQNTVPICVNGNISTFCKDNAGYQDVNPYWYKFTCFKSGSLGFLVTPNNLDDDYDWVLYDVTNANLSDVYQNTKLIVDYNWSGNTSLESARGFTGVTGASPSGTSNMNCASNPQELGGVGPYNDAPTINKMSILTQGHEYLLMVSHYTQTQSGYSLSFSGGTAIITDTTKPAIKSAAIVCGQSAMTITLNKNMMCNSLDSDGSDFVILPANATVIAAYSPSCSTGFDMSKLTLTLSNPLPDGNYTVYAKNGTDGNTLLDDCGTPLEVNDSANFIAKQAVSAQFSYQVLWGCKNDSIQFIHPGGNGINSWQWTFDSSLNLAVQNPLVIYTEFGMKNAHLIVSNGVCSDTSTQTINLDNTLKAAFLAPDNLCPEDKAVFENTSIGQIVSWHWDLGDGTSSSDSVPAPHLYPVSTSEKKYLVQLIAKNNHGCFDTASKLITRVKTCFIAVPSGFTPNGDGVNDYLYPLNAFKAINLEFRVFNRYGQLVFESKDWSKKWDGTINGRPQDPGTYVWMLQYTDMDTGKRHFLKGTSVLLR